MPDRSEITTLLSAAEAAAAAGDFRAAADRLREAASRQEAALGAEHPDLAETHNNLGIVSEKNGALDDAERHYRRAFAIATAALDAAHPFVATSRENLKAFCEAHGRPFERPAAAGAAKAPQPASQPRPAAVVKPAAPAPAKGATPAKSSKPAPAARPSPHTGAPEAPTPAALAPLRTPPARHLPALQSDARSASPLRPVLFGGAILGSVLLIVVFAYRSPADTATTPDGPDSTTPASATPPATSPASGAASNKPAAPAAARPVPAKPTAPPRDRGLPVVVNARLCGQLVTGRVDWRCDRAATPVPAGSLTFYTRLRSPRDVMVEHRWYRGSDLVQSVELRIRVNLGPGYRTYSKFSVTPGSGWRVELRTADGTVLHEERFEVR
jgi:hypothetical protein